MPKRKSSVAAATRSQTRAKGEEEAPVSKKPRLSYDAHVPISRFGMQLFAKYNENECKETNALFSPLSLGFGLSMLASGADGASQDQLIEMLHLRIKENLESVSEIKEDLPENCVKIANALLVQKNLIVKNEYKDRIHNEFYGEVLPITFGKSGSANTVNDWAGRKTDGLITRVLQDDNSLAEHQKMALLNCMYFRAEWVHQFNPENTSASAFQLMDGTERTVPFMNGVQKVVHFEAAENRFRAIKLPYNIPKRANKCSMLLFLPPEEQNIDEFVASLTFEDVHNVIEGTKTQLMSLKIPKFSMESDLLDLGRDLKALGISKVFDEENAGLDHIHKGIFLNKVFQKVRVDVDERGVEEGEEASHTEERKSKTSPKGEISFNRPFVFTIVQDHTSNILFMGKVQWPEVKEEAQ